MYIISEQVAASIGSVEATIPLVERAFADLARGDASLLPIAIGKGLDPSTSFGAKGGTIRGLGLIGVKIGSYFPDNGDKGLLAHGSTTVLLDPDTGVPVALIGAVCLSAIRTAALDAIAVRLLSRPDSSSLALIGTGYQAWWDLSAIIAVRPIERLLVWNRTRASAEQFAIRASREYGIDAQAVDIETAVSNADIIVTATASRDALVERNWVRAGTHISAIGADNPGKQELATDLVGASTLYADLTEQSITLGEFEAAYEQGLVKQSEITPIGAVIVGDASGRATDEITIFDTSGTALQDLAIAKVVLETALAQNLTVMIDV